MRSLFFLAAARVNAYVSATATATASANACANARARARALVVAHVIAAVTATATYAADEVTCSRYGVLVERLTQIATGDADIAQLVRSRAEAHCGVVDFPPLEISIDDAIGTAPASAGTDGHASDWEKRCAAGYRSFRAADGTVLRRGHKTRVRCPL